VAAYAGFGLTSKKITRVVAITEADAALAPAPDGKVCWCSWQEPTRRAIGGGPDRRGL
jgi:hypothetical protein